MSGRTGVNEGAGLRGENRATERIIENRLGKGEGREAEPLFREAIELQRDGVSPAWFRRALQSALGACLTLQGRYADAEPLLVNSYGFHELRGVSEPETYTRESLRRIIDLYEAWDASEPGEGYDAKAAEWRALFTAQEAEEAN